MMSTEPQYRNKIWRFSCRSLVMSVVILGIGIGLVVMFVIDYTSVDRRIERLHKEFTVCNPDSLKSWIVIQPGSDRRWLSWTKDGIAYFDRNADGLPDMKYREEPRMSTTEVWWEDTNYDGKFDTEVTQGCFGRIAKPLRQLIAVPSVPTMESKNVNKAG